MVDAGLSDEFIKHAFLSGLPHSLKVHVRTSVKWEKASLQDVVTEARLKAQEETVYAEKHNENFHAYASNAVQMEKSKSVIKCFRCQKMGHIALIAE